MVQGSERWNEERAPGIERRRTRRIAGAGLLAALCAAIVFAGQLPDAADGKKKKKFSIVGKWQGTTEDGGTVSYSVTRDGKIVGFTLTNVELYCSTANPGDYPGNYTRSKKTATITHGPMPMKGKSRKWPQGKRFDFHDPPVPFDSAGEGGDFTGELGDLVTSKGTVIEGKKSMLGEVAYLITNGPTPPAPAVWAPGTEACDTGGPTGRSLLDWRAKKPGTPGIAVPERRG
jgi:hypothetical protein